MLKLKLFLLITIQFIVIGIPMSIWSCHWPRRLSAYLFSCRITSKETLGIELEPHEKEIVDEQTKITKTNYSVKKRHMDPELRFKFPDYDLYFNDVYIARFSGSNAYENAQFVVQCLTDCIGESQ